MSGLNYTLGNGTSPRMRMAYNDVCIVLMQLRKPDILQHLIDAEVTNGRADSNGAERPNGNSVRNFLAHL